MSKFNSKSVFINVLNLNSLLNKISSFMKIKTLIVAMCSIVLFTTSCKKEELSSVSVSTSSTDASYTETELTKETPITKQIDNNIGGFVECLPAHYADHPTLKYPLIIYLHGSGSTGDGSQASLVKVQNDGITSWITKQQFPSNFVSGGTSYQFIVLSPQFKSWPGPADVNDMLNYAISKYHINCEKIYVSGNSMGGGVTWNFATNYGKRITAIVPVSGADYPTTEKAQPIAADSLGVWAFCNNGDPTVPSWYSEDYITYINGFSPYITAKLTEFIGTTHNASAKAYDPTYKENDMNVYEWMLSYKKVKH